MLWAAGWLIVHGIYWLEQMADALIVHGIYWLEQMADAAGEFVGGIGEAIGDLFRRKR
jgi:hypothetical protein